MTWICETPETFAASALAGFCSVHSHAVRPVPGGVVRARPGRRGKVALVVGGGSGHYPAFLGYVGPGFADAAAAGEVFTSPSTQAALSVARAADRGGGVIIAFGNYAGDVLNFGLAAERLTAEGMRAACLVVTDDIASAPPEKRALRRGVGGDLPVFRIAGAAAEAGLDFDAVMAIGQRANERTFSLGVAFSGCRLPGAGEPLFQVPEGRMAVGLGIHGEPGISEEALMPASGLARLLVGHLLLERPEGAGERVAVLLNGLGRTKQEELFALWTFVEKELREAGLVAVEPLVGEYVTSLDMAGCSLTLTWLDAELETLWLAPVDAPILKRGTTVDHGQPEEALPASTDADAPVPALAPATDASRRAARWIVSAFDRLRETLHAHEEELGRIDAVAGDGDHGRGMSRGVDAALAAARTAVEGGAGAGSTLFAAGDAWADKAGGTSGVIWGVLLRGWGRSLSDDRDIDAAAVAAGAKAALADVCRLGGAKVGDKTLVDALAPFVETLDAQVADGAGLAEAWPRAAAASSRAAKATAELTPRLGRARPLAARSLGHPDAGATSLAYCAEALSPLFETCPPEA